MTAQTSEHMVQQSAGRLIPVLRDLPFGDLVPLTRVIFDGNRSTARVYVNRRQVAWISDDHKGNTYVHLIGEDMIQVTESLEFVAGALS